MNLIGKMLDNRYEILEKIGIDVRVLQMDLSEAKDPDEYVIKYGSGRFNLLINEAISLIEFKVKELKSQYNLDNTNDKIKFLQEIAKILVGVESQIELEIQIDNISRSYSISKEAIYAEINKIKYVNKSKENENDKKPKANIERKKDSKIDEATIRRENVIIYLLINGNSQERENIKNNIKKEDLKYMLNQQLIEKIYEAIEQNKEVNNILDSMEDKDLISHFTSLMADDYEISDNSKCIEDIITSYNKERIIERRNEILTKLEDKNNTKEEIASFERELSEIILQLAKMK